MSGGRIVVGGEALVDLVPTGEGGRSATRSGTVTDALAPLAPRRGGGPYNTAIGLGRLGVPVSMLTRLSTDAFGDALLERLTDNDVDTALVGRGPEPTTLAVVTMSEHQARYSFHVEGTADRLVADPGPLPADVAAVAVGTLSLLLEPGASVYTEVAVREAHRGRFVSLDPNLRPALVTDPDATRDRFDRVAARAGLVKLSDEDAAWWGREPAELLDRGATAVVLTRGAEGMEVTTRAAGSVRVPARTAAEMVDTIGAGDSVHAALLAWLARHDLLDRTRLAELDPAGWTDALDFAARAAAVTVSRSGAEPPWTRDLDPPGVG